MTLAQTWASLSRTKRAVLGVALVVSFVALTAFWRGSGVDEALVATAHRESLTATLTATGTLRPAQSITYRSPITGRDAEIIGLAPEGSSVGEHDVLVRLDTTDLARDLDRLQQDLRQAGIDLQVAAGELEEARADVEDVTKGEGVLTVDEARTQLQLAGRRAERLRAEYAQLKPLLDKGFMTREELAKTGDLLEQAEQELGLARKRTAVVVDMTHPREEKRALLARDQKTSALEHARSRYLDIEARLELQRQLIDAATIRARRPGLVVYEELLSAVPRRKVRVGDRVFASQGIITIPEVSRMLVEASVGESDVHRVHPGQPATVRVQAYPDRRLTGKVTRVGTLASSSVFRPLDEKRFDLIVELDSNDADLRPEMTVRADVVVGTRNDVLAVPVTAVFEHQGRFLAYVAGPLGIEPRPVDLGESNGRIVEILAGLRDGDRVSLIEPPGAAAPAPPTSPAAPMAPAAAPAATEGHAPPPH